MRSLSFLKSCVAGIALAAAFLMPAKAQEVNSLYFLDNVPFLNYINPGIQPEREGFVALPVIGYGQMNVGNNSITIRDVLSAPKGSRHFPTLTHPTYGDRDRLYKKVRRNALIHVYDQTNILAFGFRFKEKNYLTFSSNLNVDAGANIPKKLMELELFGAKEMGDSYELKRMSANATAYIDAGVGYSRQVNENLSIGGRLKVLIGFANARFIAKDLYLTAQPDVWHLQATRAQLGMALPGDLSSDFKKYTKPSKVEDYIQPKGFGAGLDFGVDYKFFNKTMRLTAGFTDLGFINWKDGNVASNKSGSYEFKGMNLRTEGASLSMDEHNRIGDAMGDAFYNLDEAIDQAKSNYATMTTMKINIGYEWDFYKDILGVGVFSRTLLFQKKFYEELTTAFIVKPTNWFNMNLSYSLINGRNSFGAGMSLRGGPILFFVAADYIPFSYTTLKVNASDEYKYKIPYNSKGFNIAGGITVVWGKGLDSDKDGVRNRYDKCPFTPRGVEVDSVGCPLDEDGDGVPDYLDQCPGTPKEAKVDSVGCPLDEDGDGVPDYLDQCPGTPKEAQVDSVGCPLDEDGDGVPDYLDKCPGTPAGVKVDENGCPVDTDGDGVPDHLDKCPDTPQGIEVDSDGCPFDEDGDGVPDYLDKCPGTPIEARGKVDAVGCPLDTDGDGIPDYLDKCPQVAGPKSTNGCPELTKEVKQLFTKALQGIQFETGKAVIKKTSYPILDKIVKVMVDNPTYSLEIFGHTDNVGKPASNLKLSDDRANSVKTYMVQKGIDPRRLTSAGFGDTKPVADNKTAAGRAQNRRVEFNVVFEGTVIEKVDPSAN